MTTSQEHVDQAVSALESLSAVLSKLISPIHGMSSYSLTTKDVEVISSSRNHLHRFLFDLYSRSTLPSRDVGTQSDTCDRDEEEDEEEEGFIKVKLEEFQLLQSNEERNQTELEVLRKELQELSDADRCTQNTCQKSIELLQAKQELLRCKETLQAMKADRRRLKSDKLDLVGQMKQLYHTLEDKESELREFIRNYEQNTSDIAEQAKKLAVEKEELEQVKNAALEECRLLRAKLEIKYNPTKKIDSNSENKMLNNVVRNSFSDESVIKVAAVDSRCSSSGDDLPPYQDIYVLDMSNRSPVLPRSSSVSEAHLQAHLQKSMARSSHLLRRPPGNVQNRNSPQRERNKIEKISSTKNINETPQRQSSIFHGLRRTIADQQNAGSRVSFLSHENYEEKLKTIAEAKELAVGQWKANHVLSWLELEMNMTTHGSACADNIKSGRVLLSLSDADLDSALRLQSPLHRRKLRLAIEELRDPSAVLFPKASKMSPIWVSQDWILNLGLPQYSRAFDEQLVDGRLLNVLTKKDLDKHLNVHKKFHQSSITYGIELLRLLEFDKEKLQERRVKCREHFSDPVVWTNECVIEWANHIDLHEFSQNLKDSGIHGAVLVFDQSFTSDAFASLLGIPNSKSYVRRHLATELDAIIQPARAAIEETRSSAKQASVNSSFKRSFSGGNKSDTETSGVEYRGSGSGRKISLRDSLGRAFARRSAKDLSCERQKEARESVKSSLDSDLATDGVQLRTHQKYIRFND